MLDASELQRALAAAKGGEVLRLAPGQTVNGLMIHGHQWDKPVSIEAPGSHFLGLTLSDVRGLRWYGGSFEAPKSRTAKGAGGYGVHVLDCHDLVFEGAEIRNAYKALFATRVRRFQFSDLLVHDIQSDGVCLAGCYDGQVLRNWFRPFTPTPKSCTLPHEVTYRAGSTPISEAPQLVHGLSRQECEARGGRWKDGDHPDSMQVHSNGGPMTFRWNKSEGPQHGIGIFKPKAGETVRDITITDNEVLTSGHNAVALNGATGDNLVTRNRVGRWGDAAHKAQIRFEGSSGQCFGNINPDARPDHPSVRPLV